MLEITRVRLPFRTWAILGTAAGFGFVHGVNLWHGWISPFGIFFSHPDVDNIVGFAILLLPWALALHSRCQRIIPLIAAGLVCGSLSAFGFFYSSAMGSPLGATAIWHQFLLPEFALHWSVGTALFNLLLLSIARIVGYRVIEQNGVLCRKCGYQFVGTTCSECGHVRSEPARLTTSAMRQFIAMMLLLVAAGMTAWALWQPTDRLRASFIEDFGGEGGVHGHMYAPSGIRSWPAIGAFFGLEESSGMLLVWLTEESPQQGQPLMQLQIMGTYRAPAGNVLPHPGSPIILVDIHDSKLAGVLRQCGIPERTKAMMREIATSEGWLPIAPAAGSRIVTLSPEIVGLNEDCP